MRLFLRVLLALLSLSLGCGDTDDCGPTSEWPACSTPTSGAPPRGGEEAPRDPSDQSTSDGTHKKDAGKHAQGPASESASDAGRSLLDAASSSDDGGLDDGALSDDGGLDDGGLSDDECEPKADAGVAAPFANDSARDDGKPDAGCE